MASLLAPRTSSEDATAEAPSFWAIGWAFYAFLLFTALQLGLGILELYLVTGETLWETEQSRFLVFLSANIFCWIVDWIGRSYLPSRYALARLRVTVVCIVAMLIIFAGTFQLGTDSHVATAGIFSGVLLTLFRSSTAGILQLLACLVITLLALWARGDIAAAFSNSAFTQRPLGFALFASFLQPYMIGLIINVSLGRVDNAYRWALIRLRKLAAKNEKLANTDPLTGVQSRAGLENDFGRLLEETEQTNGHLLVVLFDLDNFKHINTFSGHVAGDTVLKHFAANVTNTLPDAHVYRLGGDEFLALLCLETKEGLPKLELDQLASEMHVQYLRDDISLTASIGFCFAESKDTLGNAISRADDAISQAKGSGKSQAQGYSDASAPVVSKSTSRTARSVSAVGTDQASGTITPREVGDAISDGSIGYFLQPIFHSRSKMMYGIEALLEWHTPSGRLVPPEKFLSTFASLEWQSPYFEHLSRIRMDLTKRISSNLSVPVHFNFRLEALGNPTYADRISGELANIAATMHGVVIEVSASALLSNQAPEFSVHQANEHLCAAQAAGAKIALDDFGAELNNFDRLRDFTIDMIKIDQKFIEKLDTEKVSQVLVGAMKKISDELGVSIVAKGVATEAQRRALIELGVDLQQGALSGQKLSPDDFFALSGTSGS